MSDALLVVSRMLAAKSINDQLGIDLAENLENSEAFQLHVQPLEQSRCAVVTALALTGNLRPEVLLPVIVQPRLMPSTAYTAQRAAVPAPSQG